MKKTLIFGALLAISLIASDDCSRETTGVLFAGGVNAAKFFEFNAGRCELKKEAKELVKQLDVRAGLMQSFNKDTEMFLCEEPNTEGLKELILNQFRIQDPAYYKQHEDDLNTYIVKNLIFPGRTKESVTCFSGYEVVGTPCHWRCAASENNSTK